ncbi:lytic transglycosylase domain-containing protein [Methylobacterium segetis]|uniref:lytic transglycosylase domain-containing protein n=1 Tax=Methylobacterium segetis TaxID=2488750 RepID=UPI001A9F8A7A|nr:lytic transglycosylase domain-containing protein [Methylobacterium segetis]
MPKLLLTPAAALSAVAVAAPACAASPGAATETVEQALCRLIESSAKARGLPVPFLTRLIWRESTFRAGVVSPAGAQGVAQFMPGTAQERGLLDPFDPEQAIPHAAHLLADLKRRFGNLGLAAAAYNGGAQRVTNWLAGSGGLPAETRAYVLSITGSPAEDWRGSTSNEASPPEAKRVSEQDTFRKPADEPRKAKPAEAAAKRLHNATHKAKAGETPRTEQKVTPQTCLQVTAALRIPSRADRFAERPPSRDDHYALSRGRSPGEKPAPPPWGPWGIQLAANFSKALALRSFSQAQATYAKAIGQARPMVIGTRLRSRGTQAFYRVRIPAQSREDADALCGKIRTVGGACIVLKT